MAINFEAANMAGYNNPPVVVFPAVLGDDGNLSNFPDKTDIISALARGALPFLMVSLLKGAAATLFPLNYVSSTTPGEYEVSFSSVFYLGSGEVFSKGSIFYPTSGDPVYYFNSQ